MIEADLPRLGAYITVVVALPMLGVLVATVVCAVLFALLAALGVGTQATAMYLAVAVLGAVFEGARRVTNAIRRLRGPPEVVSLGAVRRVGHPVREIGPKAWNLAHLADRHARVPLGWVVPSRVFSAAWHAGGEPPATATGAAEHVGTLPVSRGLIRRLHRTLVASAHESFLLRSSFGDEDGADTAQAGLYESVAWSRPDGRDALADALRSVWASNWSERAVADRERRGATGPARLAVLVQPTVHHTLAGFASSAEPASGRRDVFVLDVATRDHEWSGTYHSLDDVVRPYPGQPAERALPQEHAREVVALVERAHAQLGTPVEVEWGLDDEGLWAYQARPLTAVPDVRTYTCSHGAAMPTYPLSTLSRALLFGSEPPERTLGAGLEALHLGSLAPDDVIERNGVFYVRADKLRADELQGSRGVRAVASLGAACLDAVARRLSSSPDVPSPPAESLDARTLVEQLERLTTERIRPTLRAQSRFTQAAALLEGLGEAPLPATRVRTPIDDVIAALGGGAPPDAAVEAGWFLSEREAEVSAPRAIDDPQAFAASLGATSESEAPKPAEKRGLVARLRDRLVAHRQSHNAQLNALLYEARGLAEALSARLEDQVPDWQRELVFHLDLAELRALAGGDHGNVAVASARRATHAEQLAAEHPPVIVEDADGNPVPVASAGSSGSSDVGYGAPLGGGSATGEVLCVEHDSDLSADEARDRVVVLPSPAATFAPYAAVAAAVVMRTGGPLSHLAVWCRERGIPGVAAVSGADALLQDGTRVHVNADTGEVRRD